VCLGGRHVRDRVFRGSSWSWSCV